MKNLQIYPSVTYVETVEVTLPAVYSGSVIFLPFSTVLNNCKITGLCFNQAGGLYPNNGSYVDNVQAKFCNINLVQEDDTMVIENLPLSCLLSLNASQNKIGRAHV